MAALSKLVSAAVAGVELYHPGGKGLITFNGWDGKWWRRIDYGKGVYDAVTFVAPLKVNVAIWAVGAITKSLRKGSR